MRVCVCARVCACVRAHACVCVCARACFNLHQLPYLENVRHDIRIAGSVVTAVCGMFLFWWACGVTPSIPTRMHII